MANPNFSAGNQSTRQMAQSIPGQTFLGAVAKGGFQGQAAGDRANREEQAVQEMEQFMKDDPTMREIGEKAMQVGSQLQLPKFARQGKRILGAYTAGEQAEQANLQTQRSQAQLGQLQEQIDLNRQDRQAVQQVEPFMRETLDRVRHGEIDAKDAAMRIQNKLTSNGMRPLKAVEVVGSLASIAQQEGGGGGRGGRGGRGGSLFGGAFGGGGGGGGTGGPGSQQLNNLGPPQQQQQSPEEGEGGSLVGFASRALLGEAGRQQGGVVGNIAESFSPVDTSGQQSEFQNLDQEQQQAVTQVGRQLSQRLQEGEINPDQARRAIEQSYAPQQVKRSLIEQLGLANREQQ